MGGPVPPGPLPPPPVSGVASTAPTCTDAPRRQRLADLCLYLLMASAVHLVDRRQGQDTEGWGGLPLEKPVFGKMLQNPLSSRVPPGEGPHTPRSLAGTPVPPWASLDEDQGLSQVMTLAGTCPLVSHGGARDVDRGPRVGADPQACGVRWVPRCKEGASRCGEGHPGRRKSHGRRGAAVPSWQMRFVWENQCLGTGRGEMLSP